MARATKRLEARSNVVRLEEARQPARAPALPTLAALPLVAFDAQKRVARVAVGPRQVAARVDATVDSAVLVTALARGERVLVEQGPRALVVLGTLRTQATPGLDVGDDYVIRASRVRVEGEHEVTLTSGKASLALRAVGVVETIAQDITTRASALHKLVGRMLRLN